MCLHDLPAAVGLLTRLPVPVDSARAMARGAAAAWAYPLVGVLVAGLAGTLYLGVTGAGMPAELATGLALLTLVAVTGALHEDGLADTVDGLWGGWTRERRLEIMKDSHIGTYGVLALVFSVGLRWAALDSLASATDVWCALIGAAALSRGAMVGVWVALAPARPSGLAAQVGRPGRWTASMAGLIAFAVAAAALGIVTAAVATAAAALAAACLGQIARNRIGGQTGDILGASQQVSEIAVLLVLATLAI
jgi:adenosylcobinamide-GDP ribazoletransferase